MSMRGALTAVAVVASALAATANAKIVPQSAIAGVRLGMTQAQVQSQLGKPLGMEHKQNEFGSYTRFNYFGNLIIDFQGNATVTAVSTTGKTERTARGIGVGSTKAQVLRLVSGVRCETGSGFAHCYIGSFTPGKRVTDFRLSRGRVARVTIGFVID